MEVRVVKGLKMSSWMAGRTVWSRAAKKRKKSHAYADRYDITN